jgi:hypothetical protein
VAILSFEISGMVPMPIHASLGVLSPQNGATTLTGREAGHNLCRWNNLGPAIQFIKQGMSPGIFAQRQDAIFAAFKSFGNLFVQEAGCKYPFNFADNYCGNRSSLLQSKIPSSLPSPASSLWRSSMVAFTTNENVKLPKDIAVIDAMAKAYPCDQTEFPADPYFDCPNEAADIKQRTATGTASHPLQRTDRPLPLLLCLL